MKRWQDRGVVEDSEDDELSLELESQSPERPRKRAKHSQEPETHHDQPIVLLPRPADLAGYQDGDELDLFQPKVAKTYSRKATAPKKALPKPGRRGNSPEENRDAGIEGFEPISSSFKSPISTSEQAVTEQQPGPPSSLPTLPHLDTFPNRPTINDERQSLSAASSPLSERDVSPPPELQHLERFHHHLASDEQLLDPADETIANDSTGGELPQSTAIVRRNLRARKAIQLNPYQFDRAQYLQQCKARGIKPVRLIEQQNAHNEAESQSQSASSPIQERSSALSSPVHSAEQRQPAKANREGLDYFDAANLSDAENRSSHRLPKRRKLVHGFKKGKSAEGDPDRTAHSTNSWSQLDEFSIPPSPPRTSSDLSNVEDGEPMFKQTASGFRIPLGLTPVPLPTPQISSDTKQHDEYDSVSDSPPRLSRASTIRRQRRTLSAISISSESIQESDVESDLETKRLQREQKRIKGVLPASWLKIDLQAQQRKRPQEMSNTRRHGTESPAKPEAQKGVARKVAQTTQRDYSTDFVDLPGGNTDSDDSTAAPSRSLVQARLDLGPDRFTMARSMTLDEDLMENDFVDPMLAGPSRQGKPKSKRTHQPRITDTFSRSSNPDNKFLEERRAKRATFGSKQRSHASNGSSIRRRHKPAVRLSIADAPRSPSTENQQVPQFIKLALRQTRRAPDRGRHSPSRKVIRLATAEETEDATSVLRAWREGTMAPCADGEDSEADHDTYVSFNDDFDPLPHTENARDERQQGFPAPIYKKKRSNHGSSRPIIRRRMQQTRLHPVELQPDAHRSLPAANDQRANQPAVRQRSRQLPPRQRLRGAQLETLERDFDETHREAMFERRMQCMTESVARPMHQFRDKGFQLDRFLRASSTAVPEEQSSRTDQHEDGQNTSHNTNRAITLAHRPRKARARRLDVDARQYRQPSEPLPYNLEASEPMKAGVDDDAALAQPILQGLRPFGTRYPIDFDINPLSSETSFRSGSFIGSGDFNDALNLAARDLEREAGHVRVHVEDEVYEWGAWNEDVATQINRIPRIVGDALDALDEAGSDFDLDTRIDAVDRNVGYLLRSTVRYLSNCVYFIDPVDRQTCVERLNDFSTAIADSLSVQRTSKASHLKTLLRALLHRVVIAKQTALLSDHSTVSLGLRKKAEELLLQSAKSLAKHGIGDQFAKLRSFYEDNCKAAVREAGIEDDTGPFASLVLLRHSLLDSNGTGQLFWQVIQEALHTKVGSLCNVQVFDSIWHNLFTVLPALEMDAAGVLRAGPRFTTSFDGWSLIKVMVSRVLELYESSSQIRGYSVNEYVRVVLTRCHCLVNKWGWWRCEPVLNTVFDFFARRSFSLLHKEESRGSPKFLEELSSPDLQLEITPDDCSFHVLLKMLATGILGMRRHRCYNDRKIQGIIWRFIPNHNRVYRKDFDLQKADLEALRNQHDLFNVLYFASPPKDRVRVELVLGLVDHSTSHREACRLSVRAWANIASYQASTSEPKEALEELTGWFADTLKTTFAQYRLAKTEAEQDFDRAKQEAQDVDGTIIDQETLETTIASNQRQVAAIVVDALAGLKRAILASSSLTKAQTLVECTNFWTVFDLFDPSQRRLLGAVQEALIVCETALDIEKRFASGTGPQQPSNDDSQDFGDSSALEAFAANDQVGVQQSAPIADALLLPVGHFLSNVFGADSASEDLLLQQVIDIWARLAEITVQSSAKGWSSYVDDYAATAWSQLRDTTQKRKFTPYFMSQIVIQSKGDEEVRQPATMAWLLCLIEREAMLKFQHYLTSALLNHCEDEALLSNLPFTRERSSGQYDVTLHDLRQRRLALISSVLSNMRTHYDEVCHESPSSGQELRSRYGGMLRQLMQAMKVNYQDLQAVRSGSVADASVQGGYVDFVQQVVSFLQQYALGICQVDRFFTDSTAFPLPATDPTYVVGRLRSYVPKLSEGGGRTQLAIFVQTVSERAAIDNEQKYLVTQMAAAMSDVEEQGDDGPITLRRVLLTSIFPAYIANALSTACSWIPALPMLQACEMVIRDMFYNFAIENSSAVAAVIETVTGILHCICLQCDHMLVHPGRLESSHALRTLVAMFGVAHASLTITSYIQRATSLGGELSKRMQTLQEQALSIEAHLQDQAETHFIDTPDCGPAPATPWPDTRAVADKQVRESVNAKWHAIEGQVFVQRGNTMKEVVVELGDSRDEKTRLLQVIASFCRAFEATLGGPHQTRRKQAACDDLLGGVLV